MLQDEESPAHHDRGHKFLSLDGLRGIAALSVVAGHYADFFGGNPLPGAHIAVDIFFMMSGFVIAYSYDDRLRGELSVRQFAVVRIIRLAPLYWLGTSISVVAIAAALTVGIRFDLWNWTSLGIGTIASLLLVPGVPLGSQKMFLLNIPGWSLFYEMVVNLAYASAFKRLTTGVICGCLAVGATGLLVCVLLNLPINAGGDIKEFSQGLLRVLFGFSLGLLFARKWRAGRLPKWGIRPAGLYILLLLLMLHDTSMSRYPGLYDFLVVVVVCPVILCCAINVEPAAKALSAWMGRVSYPLYIIHVPLGMVVVGAIKRIFGMEPADAGIAGGIAMMALAVILAGVLDRWFDQPVRRWISRHWRRSQRAALFVGQAR